MHRLRLSAVCAVVLALITFSGLSSPARQLVRIDALPAEAGVRTVEFAVYASAEGGEPIWTGSRSVQIDAKGLFAAEVDGLSAALGHRGEPRWLATRIPPAAEGRRIQVIVNASAPRRIAVQAVEPATIGAGGIIHSSVGGFRFPDGTEQTTAATVTGGVPNVNGIAGAVNITGAGNVSVGTAGSTITVTGLGLSGVTAGTGLTGGGTSGSPTISASLGSPVAVGSSNADGTATTLARSDHVHAHGNQAGGTLHSAATTGTAGFMSSTDKTKLDGTVAYLKTVVVSPSGVDSLANGVLLRTALANIPSPSTNNRYLLKIEPGIYDISPNRLDMRSFVDVEGSGQGSTFVTSNVGGSVVLAAEAVVRGANNSTLRHLSVTSTGTSQAVAMGFYSNFATMTVENVTVSASGGTGTSLAFFAEGGTLTVRNVILTVTGTATNNIGVQMSNGVSATLTGATITVSGGTTNQAVLSGTNTVTATIDSSSLTATGSAGNTTAVRVSVGKVSIYNSVLTSNGTAGSTLVAETAASTSATLLIAHSTLKGASSTSFILAHGANSKLRIGTSMIDGVVSSGTPTCVHTYDANFNALTVCPQPIP